MAVEWLQPSESPARPPTSHPSLANPINTDKPAAASNVGPVTPEVRPPPVKREANPHVFLVLRFLGFFSKALHIHKGFPSPATHTPPTSSVPFQS